MELNKAPVMVCVKCQNMIDDWEQLIFDADIDTFNCPKCKESNTFNIVTVDSVGD